MSDEAKKVMERFMDKLKSGELKKEIQSNKGHPMTDDYIEEQVTKYGEFLKSDLMQDICKM